MPISFINFPELFGKSREGNFLLPRDFTQTDTNTQTDKSKGINPIISKSRSTIKVK